MVVEYDEEFFTIKLRHDIGEPPYEVIPIDELLEVWEKHKADTPQTYKVDLGNGFSITANTADTPQTEEKHAICNGCVYCDLPNAFHPCASCVDFSKYVGEVSGDTPQTDCPWK